MTEEHREVEITEEALARVRALIGKEEGDVDAFLSTYPLPIACPLHKRLLKIFICRYHKLWKKAFETAITAVMAAAVLDGLDGRIARALKGTSRFGAELDSLSDFVDFGVAPALLLYLWSLHEIKGLGWFAVLVFVIAAALRLARFNVNIEVVDRRFFQGIPSPAAAALVAGFIWLACDNNPSTSRCILLPMASLFSPMAISSSSRASSARLRSRRFCTWRSPSAMAFPPCGLGSWISASSAG